MTCGCGHPPHHHTAAGCHNITVTGPATPHNETSPAHLHIGRTLRHCGCGITTQPGTGDQVQTPEKEEENG